jgi:hypothetical protein
MLIYSIVFLIGASVGFLIFKIKDFHLYYNDLITTGKIDKIKSCVPDNKNENKDEECEDTLPSIRNPASIKVYSKQVEIPIYTPPIDLYTTKATIDWGDFGSKLDKSTCRHSIIEEKIGKVQMLLSKLPVNMIKSNHANVCRAYLILLKEELKFINSQI